MKKSALRRKTPLKRSQKGLKRTPLAKMSKKQRKRSQEYSKLRKDYLEAFPVCQVCGREAATQVHHVGDGVGPKRGSNTNNVETWLPVCFSCHERIEMNKSWARKEGYLR